LRWSDLPMQRLRPKDYDDSNQDAADVEADDAGLHGIFQRGFGAE